MKKLIVSFVLTIVSLVSFAQKDPFVGFYKGELEAPKYGYPFDEDNAIYGEVFRDASGYRLKLFPYIFVNAEVLGQADKLQASGAKIMLSGVGAGEKFNKFNGEITPQEINLQVIYLGKPAKIKLDRMEITPPTLGKKAPKGATVLFDGSNLDAFKFIRKGKEYKDAWILENGEMVAITNRNPKMHISAISKQVFDRPLFMHVEFKMPCVYDKKRAWRSNSGIIFFNTYEVQLLESFGSEGYWDETGAVYRQIAPKVNASLPAGEWQTFDIQFYPAVYKNGKLVSYPFVNVWHNGIVVQKESPIKFPTVLHPKQGAQFDQSKHPRKGVIQIQDHGADIRFRNIWVKEMDSLN